jgi:LysM repeat protein/outer membrane protein assembly factor BamD (BamD/ComL family)
LFFLALAGALVLVWGGCGDSERFTYATETDEPNYREGQSLLKAGRRQEALTAFLKVIDRRRDDAPESHLEVGLLYVQHINDPLSAIYHFRKYLAQRPNSPQAPLVRQRIDAAIREFARTIPAQPLENQTQRVDLIATLDRLKQENESLKQQLADARAARASPVQAVENTVAATPEVTPTSGSGTVRFSLETPSTVPTVRTQTNAAPSRSASSSTVAPARPSVITPAAPVAGSRRHVVQPGDTLSKLAQQYYSNRAKWRDIYAANRNVMKNESDLRVGMELRIP